MKNFLSVSVGSSQRDHTTVHTFLGQDCHISRQGTDGDYNKAIQMYRDFDGKVDAFGVRGLEFYIKVANKRYYMRDVKRVTHIIKFSKVGDGNRV